MEIVDPKCPICGKAKHLLKIPTTNSSRLIILEIKELQEKIETIQDSEDKTMLEEYLESRKKTIDNILNKSAKTIGEASIVFCKECWEIIRKSDDKY